MISADIAPHPWAAILPSLPLPAFALASLFASRLAAKMGMLGVLAASAAAIAIAEAVRASGSLPLLLIGTAVALLGAAVQLAVLPGVIHRYFPHSFGLLTGVFVALMSLTSAVASGAFVPLAAVAGGWRGVVAMWAIPAALAAVAWFIASLAGRRSDEQDTRSETGTKTPVRLVALMALLFACQAATAFTVMGWLPSILTAEEHTTATASIALGAVLVVGLPASLAFSTVSQRERRGLSSVLLSAMTLVGLVLLPVANHPTVLVIAVILLGVGSAIYPVVLVIISRAAAPGDLVRTSAVVQGVGYAIAAPVPFILGAVADTTDWSIAILLVCPIALAQGALSILLMTGSRASSPGPSPKAAESPVGTVHDN
jgi:CP family cyanate transporter-like MFS transporter